MTHIPWADIRQQILLFCMDAELDAFATERLVRDFLGDDTDDRFVRVVALDVIADLLAEHQLQVVEMRAGEVTPWSLSIADTVARIREKWSLHRGSLAPGDVFWLIADKAEHSELAWRPTAPPALPPEA